MKNNFKDVQIELLNTLDYPGFPKHKLRLKKKMILVILMLMRNVNKKEGLWNGACPILKETMETTLKCYNPVQNEIVFVPRIELRSYVKKGYLLWKRRQFPA